MVSRSKSSTRGSVTNPRTRNNTAPLSAPKSSHLVVVRVKPKGSSRRILTAKASAKPASPAIPAICAITTPVAVVPASNWSKAKVVA